MALVTSDTKLADIIIGDPNVITVLNRFNIRLGVSDKSVERICDEYQLDSEFFETILNTFINEDYFPENILKTFNASKIVDYLDLTNRSYQQFQIPNIERHFNFLLSKSNGENNNLALMYRFFIELKEEMLKRINRDTSTLFPEINQLSATGQISDIERIIHFDEEDSIEEKLSDLKNMFVIHLNGEYDLNLCHAVLFAIISLEKDIKQNNRIRSRILLPFLNNIKEI